MLRLRVFLGVYFVSIRVHSWLVSAFPVFMPWRFSGFDAAGECLDEIAAGKSEGNHGREHVENRQGA